jgi:hypothetical protein
MVERVVSHLGSLGADEVEEFRVTEKHMQVGLPTGVRGSDEARLRTVRSGFSGED